MKVLKILLVLLAVAAAVVALAGPIGPVPGFFIGGSATAVPAAWGDTGEVHEIKLKVGTGAVPRVVIIWVVQVDGVLHVVGSKDSGWTQMIGSGGPVEMRMGDKTYTMRAVPVTEEFESIMGAYIGKYQADYPEIIAGFPDLEEARSGTAVYRLVAL